MNKKFVPYELACELKKIGFDKPCLGVYELIVVGDTIPKFRYNFKSEELWFNHNDIKPRFKDNQDFFWSAPLYEDAFAWFREKHGLHGIIYPYSETKSGMYGWMIWFIGETDNGHVTKNIKSSMTDAKPLEERCWTPENAQQKCIEKMIKIVKGEEDE